MVLGQRHRPTVFCGSTTDYSQIATSLLMKRSLPFPLPLARVSDGMSRRL